MELTPWTDDLRARLERRQREQMVPKLRLGLLAGATLFISFIAWDYLAVPESVWVTLPARIAFCGLFISLFGLSQFKAVAKRPIALLYAAVTLAAAGVATISLMLPLGHVFATSALMLTVVVLAAILPSLRIAIVSYSLLLVVAVAALFIGGANAVDVAGVSLFVISSAAVSSVMCHVSAKMAARSIQLEATLERRAMTDVLSKALNRGAFFESAARELSRAGRHGYPVSAIILDIDHFKRVNDTHGHPVGDAAIEAFASTVRNTLRGTDLFGRIGGEEFAVMVAHTDEMTAVALAERLRREVSFAHIDTGHGRLKLTVSVGVASWSGPGEDVNRLLARADAALYAAKHAGRNRVVSAPAAA